jgi:hypothetical protein
MSLDSIPSVWLFIIAIMVTHHSYRFKQRDGSRILRTRLERHVERRLGGAAEAGETTGRDHITQPRFSGLSAKAQSDFLRQRRW